MCWWGELSQQKSRGEKKSLVYPLRSKSFYILQLQGNKSPQTTEVCENFKFQKRSSLS